MHETDYKFAIEMLTTGGVSLGQYPVTVDWEPAREYARLLGMRRNGPDAAPRGVTAAIEPMWDDEKSGEPYAVGARLTDGDVVCAVKKEYFKPLAIELSSELVEKKALKTGDLFHFRILAYRQPPEAEASHGIRFTVRDATPPIKFVEAPLAELAGASVDCGVGESDDIPVFIPQSVMDEADAITREAGSNETGGILIGSLRRDPAIPEIAVVVTAQIPARHTESKTTSLTFTAETWTAVQSALDLRRSGEMMLGWWHSHPSFAFCNDDCPPERRKTCSLQKAFLSGADLGLHRTVFPKAWHIALLANNADAGLEFALFGWRGGVVQRRGFNILGAPRKTSESAPLFLHEPSTGDTDHATPIQK